MNRMLGSLVVIGISLSLANAASGQEQKDPNKQEVHPGLKALKHSNPQVRYNAVALLAKLGKTARFALPHLKELLKDPNQQVRIKTVETMWTIDEKNHKELIGVLLEAMKSKEPVVRAEALNVLGQFGTLAKDAVPIVTESLKDKEFNVRLQAVFAAGAIGPAAKSTVPELLEIIRNDEIGLLEAHASVAITKIGSRAVPILIEALGNMNIKTRRVACYTLGLIGPKAYEAVPALSKALGDKEGIVRAFAAEALGRIGLEAESSVKLLKNALDDPDPSVRINVATAMWRINKKTDGLKVLAKELSANKDSELRSDAAKALGEFGAKAMPVISSLENALMDKSVPVRTHAVVALAKIGPPAKGSAEKLAELLGDKDAQVRLQAAHAMWKIGASASPKVIDALKSELANESPVYREMAVRFLGELKAAAKEVVPSLLVLTRDRNKNVREAAAVALKQIDPKLAAEKGIK